MAQFLHFYGCLLDTGIAPRIHTFWYAVQATLIQQFLGRVEHRKPYTRGAKSKRKMCMQGATG